MDKFFVLYVGEYSFLKVDCQYKTVLNNMTFDYTIDKISVDKNVKSSNVTVFGSLAEAEKMVRSIKDCFDSGRLSFENKTFNIEDIKICELVIK